MSVPVSWDEVEDAARTSTAAALVFSLADVPRRAAQGDLFAPVLSGGEVLDSRRFP